MPKEMSLKLFLFILVIGLYSFFVLKSARPLGETPHAAITTEAQQTTQSSLAPQAN